MGAVARVVGGRLHVGSLALRVRHEVFDDPQILALISSGGLGGMPRILSAVLPEPDYLAVRSALAEDGAGAASEILQAIVAYAAPHLPTFMWMLQEHSGALGADLHRFHGLRLHEALVNESPRWLSELAVNLPAEGALHRAANPDWQWDIHAHLAAAQIDVLQMMRWEAAKLAGAKPGRKPEPVDRPGVKPSAEVKTIGKGEGFESIEEFDAWYAGEEARMRPAPDPQTDS